VTKGCSVEETEGRRKDRGPERGQRAIEVIRAGKEKKVSREDRRLLRKQMVIVRIEGCRGNRVP
jgi:hypothetical protein